jgi:hypothetical protein
MQRSFFDTEATMKSARAPVRSLEQQESGEMRGWRCAGSARRFVSRQALERHARAGGDGAAAGDRKTS